MKENELAIQLKLRNTYNHVIMHSYSFWNLMNEMYTRIKVD